MKTISPEYCLKKKYHNRIKEGAERMIFNYNGREKAVMKCEMLYDEEMKEILRLKYSASDFLTRGCIERAKIHYDIKQYILRLSEIEEHKAEVDKIMVYLTDPINTHLQKMRIKELYENGEIDHELFVNLLIERDPIIL